MESHNAGFPPFPHSLEIPYGIPTFPRPRRLDIDLLVPAQLEQGRRKGVVTDVSGPQRNACPGTLTPLPCLYLNVKDTNSRTALLSLHSAVVFVLRFLSGREPGGVQRQSLKLPYAGWLPHERVSSQACLGLSAGVGEELLPKGLSRITMTGRPVPHPIRWDSSTQVAI